MKFVETELKSLMVVELVVHGDQRGFFTERFQEAKFRENGLPTRFVQDNHSRSAPGVLRGLHFQVDPPQGKLVGVVRGKIWDVAVDVRADSPTFGKYFGIELSDENGKLLWIPPGFAHGFQVIGDGPADVLYKVDNLWNATGEGGIHFADPELGIRWPIPKATVSGRDERLQSFSSYRKSPAVWK
jgi:dTDP-4-dehydrorhamnose 3,5-epimerase